MTIKKIMEKDAALKILDELKDKICGDDLDKICDDNVNLEINDDETNQAVHKLVQAIMCGLVYWSEDDNCMVQTFIKPLVSGEITIKEIKYKYQVTLGAARDINAKNEQDRIMHSLGIISGRPAKVFGKLSGQDLLITIGCLSFFGK